MAVLILSSCCDKHLTRSRQKQDGLTSTQSSGEQTLWCGNRLIGTCETPYSGLQGPPSRAPNLPHSSQALLAL